MGKSINIDYDLLDKNINHMKSLINQLEEPAYDKLKFWTNDAMGSGSVHKNLYAFTNRTIDYHDSVKKIIKNTRKYLKSVKEIENIDQKIAKAIDG